MGNPNEDLIKKTLTTSEFFAGGLLAPKKQAKFVGLVKAASRLLKLVRVELLDQPKMDIDKLHIGEPVTESADENVDTGNMAQPKFNKIAIECMKVRSFWQTTTEAFQANIEQAALEDHLVNLMSERIATDLEMLAISGDMSTVGTDSIARLLRRLDGWDKQTENSHILDAGGSSISKGIFSEMKRRVPKHYRNDPGLRWLMSDTIANDWLDLISDRSTPRGDAALMGESVSPFGIPMEIIPLIPDDKALSVTEATAALVRGIKFGPFEIKAGANDKLKLDIDNSSAVTVTLKEGVWHAVEIANQINGTPGLAGVASEDSDGRIVLKSPTTGVASEVDIQTVGNDAYDTLGLTVGVVNGTDDETETTIEEGSFMFLMNPKNLVWSILNGTRIYAEYNKNYDRVETVVYNHIDAKIENIDAVVKCTNLRRRDLI